MYYRLLSRVKSHSCSSQEVPSGWSFSSRVHPSAPSPLRSMGLANLLTATVHSHCHPSTSPSWTSILPRGGSGRVRPGGDRAADHHASPVWPEHDSDTGWYPGVHRKSRVAPGNCTPRPSQIPDMTVSGHPARVTPRRPAGRPRTPTGSSRCRLARRRRAGDPPPSLPGSYPSSSLLRGGPPLPGALVLSASRVPRLGLFPWHHRQGSHVLHGSPGWSHVPFTPDAT